jgi:hypothetical protein
MSKLFAGIFVGAIVALAVAVATEPAVRERVRRLAGELVSCGCFGAEGKDGTLSAQNAADFGSRVLAVIKERYQSAVEESRAAATEERQRLWARFEQARDTGRADADRAGA